jgi:vitamin B12 transporter
MVKVQSMSCVAMLIAFFFSLNLAMAQNETDTTVQYRLKEVVVTGTRLDVVSDKSPSSVTVLDKATLEARNGDVVAAAIQGSPGIYLRSYGSAGALATLSVRGQNPEHTLVLVDGQRYSNFQNGNTDLGIFSLANIERIEMARGGYSSLYGADAVGGVINIIMQRPQEQMRGSVASTAGSYGYQSYQGSVSGSEGRVGFVGDAKIERGRGDYQYFFDDGGTRTLLKRDDSDFRMFNTGAKVSGAALPSLNYFVSTRYADAERGSPNGVSSTTNMNLARLRDRDVFAQAGIDWTGNENIVPRLNSSFHYGHETYTDPTYASDDYYFNRTLTISPEVRFSFSPALKGIAGADIARASIISDIVEEKVRNAQSVFLSTEHVITIDNELISDVIFYPSIRYDRYSDVTSDLSPKLGINAGVLHSPNVRVRASYGKSFRMPTFNEMYFKYGGNPLLQPERSLGFDAGVVAAYGGYNRFSAEANYFSIHTRDRIVWSPDADFNYTPKNIREVASNGVELIAGWRTADGKYSVDCNSTWTNATKQNEDFPGDPTLNKKLVYVPERVMNLSATASLYGVVLYLRETWVSRRFTSETNDKQLPAYAATDIAVRRSFALGGASLFVKGEVSNLLNESYQIIDTYPMPLREFRVTAGVEL